MKRLPYVIAEIKTESPFGFKSEKTWDELFEIACKIGDVIAIHTDARWGGSFDLIRKAKQRLKDRFLDHAIPILAKGIHSNDNEVHEAYRAGARYVLTVGRLSKLGTPSTNFIEPYDLNQLNVISREYTVIWNTRDLKDGGLKKETFQEARQIFSGRLCQASNIKTVEDIMKGADIVLVGTYLESFCKSVNNCS